MLLMDELDPGMMMLRPNSSEAEDVDTVLIQHGGDVLLVARSVPNPVCVV